MLAIARSGVLRTSSICNVESVFCPTGDTPRVLTTKEGTKEQSSATKHSLKVSLLELTPYEPVYASTRAALDPNELANLSYIRKHNDLKSRNSSCNYSLPN